MKVFKKSGIITIGIILLHITLFGQTKDFQKANTEAKSYVKKRANKGLVVGIIKNGKTRILSYGQLSTNNKQAPDGNTIFEIGGITTVFTTTLTKLEEKKGLFKMEDPIQNHIQGAARVPAFRPEVCFEKNISDYPSTPNDIGHDYVICMPMPMSAASCITFCHLASHTSGLPSNPKGLFSWNPFKKDKQKRDPYVDFAKEELYKNMEKVLLNYKPGSVFDYSNWGIALLGNLTADIANQTYGNLLEERILQPLGLTDTRLVLHKSQNERFATGHTLSGKPTDHWHFQSMAPALGLKSSANDLLTFIKANINTKEEDLADAFEQVHQPYIDTYAKRFDRKLSMGYGWFTSRLNEATNMPIQWISGGTGGFRSFVGFNKDTQTGVVVLSNSSNPVDELGFLFLEGMIPPIAKKGIVVEATINKN